MKFSILDVETTGTNPYQHKILEIAIITLENWIVKEKFSTLINPQTEIPEKSNKIHGISQKEVIDAPTFLEISDLIRSKLENSIIVGYNVLKFDLKFINYELFRNSKYPIFPQILDLSNFNNFFKAKSLASIAKKLKIKVYKMHRALPDAEITLKILRWLKEHLGEDTIYEHIFSFKDKAYQITEIINKKEIMKITYRGRYSLRELIGFPIDITPNRIIFYSIYRERCLKLFMDKIIEVSKEF